jgi:molecular chaperone GrpE
LSRLIGEVMANTGAGSHTEPSGLAENPRPEAASGQGQEEQTVAHSGDWFAAWEKTKAERDELLDRLARTQAEFVNTRKRLNKEQDEFKELALADAIKSLLPILDGFDWAIQSPYQNVEEFRSGISLIRKQLQDSLSNLGLRAIPADGEPFDPRLHQAVEVVNTTVTQDNQVLKDLRRGYKLKDRLLRPTMVLVAHNPEGDAQGEQSKRL